MSGQGSVDGQLSKVVSEVQMPLDNIAYTIEAYLLANGARLDIETRLLLAGVRDCADRVADSVRRIARQESADGASARPCRKVEAA